MFEPGEVLGERYRIVRRLGQGGMGAVFLAQDARLEDLLVAVKVQLDVSDIMPEVASTTGGDLQSDAMLFEQEACALARLKHPGLPKVTDHFSTPRRERCLVMEYISGSNLEASLETGIPIPEALVLDYADQLCEILAYLHSQSPPVIHRDVKPGNILLTPQGRTVLVDFGIAKAGVAGVTLTRARAVSSGYSPPEQYSGAVRTDARSDVYALGATLCALITARMPPAATERAAGEIVSMSVAGSRSNSPALVAVIEKAMCLRPADRYPNIESMKADLLSVQAGILIGTEGRPPTMHIPLPTRILESPASVVVDVPPPDPARSRRRLRVIWIAAICLLAVMAAFAVSVKVATDRRAAQQARSDAELRQAASDSAASRQERRTRQEVREREEQRHREADAEERRRLQEQVAQAERAARAAEAARQEETKRHQAELEARQRSQEEERLAAERERAETARTQAAEAAEQLRQERVRMAEERQRAQAAAEEEASHQRAEEARLQRELDAERRRQEAERERLRPKASVEIVSTNYFVEQVYGGNVNGSRITFSATVDNLKGREVCFVAYVTRRNSIKNVGSSSTCRTATYESSVWSGANISIASPSITGRNMEMIATLASYDVLVAVMLDGEVLATSNRVQLVQ